MTKKKEETVVVKDQPYRVFVVGGHGNYDYIRMLFEMGYRGATCVEEADIVLFTGGEDVSPELYDEVALRTTHYNKTRDDAEMAVFEEAKKLGKPMVGICRGGQFLNVACKGKMWQHVNNHAGNHMCFVVDSKGKEVDSFWVTSTHHQMMIPGDTADVLAVGCKSTEFFGYGKDLKIPVPNKRDVEVVWYDKEGCLCFQPHPEFKDAPPKCTGYFKSLLDNLVVPKIWEFNKVK